MVGRTSEGVGKRKLSILRALRDNGDMTTNELLEDAEITRSTIHTLMSRKVREGYVERETGTVTPGQGSNPTTFRLTDRGRSHLEYLEREVLDGE